jgi:hypothetical protein
MQKIVPDKFIITDSPDQMFGAHFEWLEDDATHMKTTIDSCIKRLAEECRYRRLKAFGKPDLPYAVDMAAVVTNPNNNMSLRIVRMFDMLKYRMVNRIDMVGA